jgi:hypothetical protein
MKKSILALSAACALSMAPIASAHEHYNAGVIDLNGNKRGDAGEQLALLNFPSTGLVVHMVLQPSGTNVEYGGYYSLDQRARSQYPEDYFTFTALSDGTYDIAGQNHAATGAFIKMVITTVVGPAGSEFGFWEGEIGSSQAWSKNHTTPTWVSTSGQPLSFQISEGMQGIPDDPQGHIHNRGWTANMEGVYTVGFQLIDAHNIQTPSQIYYVTFLAGNAVIPEPSTIALLIGGTVFGGFAWVRSRRKAGQS